MPLILIAVQIFFTLLALLFLKKCWDKETKGQA
jgi:hypothetical protein